MPRGPVQAFYEAGSQCRSDRALIFFGNHLVPPSHIFDLLDHKNDSLVKTAFSNLSENNCKIATINEDMRVLNVARYDHLERLDDSQVYLDVPYSVPNDFFSMETFPVIKRLFVKTPMSVTNVWERSGIYVVNADFPPEFHYRMELTSLEDHVQRYFGEFISSEKEGTK